MLRRSRSCSRSAETQGIAEGRIVRLGASLALAILLAACASLGPKPWEHDLMAKREMQTNPYPLIAAADDHLYFSKEGSSGGRSFAGGGCGCN